MNPTFMMRGGAAGMGFPFGGIAPLIIGLVLIGTIVFLIIRNSKLKKKNDSSAVILKERLAKGEINPEEYDNLKAVLKK